MLAMQCLRVDNYKLFFVHYNIISTNCTLKYFKRNIIYLFFWRKKLYKIICWESSAYLDFYEYVHFDIICQSCLHDVLRTKSQFRAHYTMLKFSPSLVFISLFKWYDIFRKIYIHTRYTARFLKYFFIRKLVALWHYEDKNYKNLKLCCCWWRKPNRHH